MKYYVIPDLERKPDLVILDTGINDHKSISSSEEIANKIISLDLSLKENGQQILLE